ncbi:hypothetical protein CRUP_019334 [Coryphaenoides rupestris]|nr:hypothetical protein CRUP_019334 [Coryphaenoides rupestris]
MPGEAGWCWRPFPSQWIAAAVGRDLHFHQRICWSDVAELAPLSLLRLKALDCTNSSQRDSIPASNLLFYLGGAAALVVLVVLVLGMLAAKRKTKNGVLNFKSHDGPMMDGGQGPRWLEEVPPKRSRTEDKPLLPLPLDGGVDHGFTPLMLASLRTGGGSDCGLHAEEEEESGGDEPGPSVISDLIGQGATLLAQTDRTGETALHLAARYARADAAKRLLDAGADANSHDNMGRTPLHAAVAADAQGVFQVREGEQITSVLRPDHYQITILLRPDRYQITIRSPPYYNQITARSLPDN